MHRTSRSLRRQKIDSVLANVQSPTRSRVSKSVGHDDRSKSVFVSTGKTPASSNSQTPGVETVADVRAQNSHPHRRLRSTNVDVGFVGNGHVERVSRVSDRRGRDDRPDDISAMSATKTPYSPVGQEPSHVHCRHDKDNVEPRVVVLGPASLVIPLLADRRLDLVIVVLWLVENGCG